MKTQVSFANANDQVCVVTIHFLLHMTQQANHSSLFRIKYY